MAPILVFVYNRTEHLKKMMTSLMANAQAKDSELIIVSDAAKDGDVKNEQAVSSVREYIKNINGFAKIEIICRDRNWGLANNIIDGVSQVLKRYEEVIVLEDDLLLSPYFLSYMNQGLSLYRDEPRVASIHGYVYPVNQTLSETFFLRGADCWGWATWRRAWDGFEQDANKLLAQIDELKLKRQFNFNGAYDYYGMLKSQQIKNDSWAVRWHASCFLKNMLTLYPGKTFVENLGLDGSGVHKGTLMEMNSEICNSNPILKKIPLLEDAQAFAAIEGFLKRSKLSFWKKAVKKVLRSV